MFTRTLAAVLFCFLFQPLSAYVQGELRFQRSDNTDGLSQNSVYALLQDQHGFLWVGTLEGLNRYDGYEFKVYKHDPKRPESLVNNYIQALAMDAQGRIWVGTFGGLDLYDERRDHFVHYPEGESGLLGAGVSSLFVDRRGSLWVGTRSGLNRYLPGQDRFQAVNFGEELDHVLGMTQDGQGNLWVGTRNGLFRYNHKSGDLGVYRMRDYHLPSNQVSSLCPDGSGGIWLGTYGGLARFLPANNSIETYLPDEHNPYSPADDDINVLYRDAEGTLWVGTRDRGLDFLDEGGRFIHHQHHPGQPDSLSHNGVLSLLHDNNGILWVGTDVGLNKFDAATRRFGLIRNLSAGSPNPGANDVRTVSSGRDQTIWLGTYGHGLTRLDRQGEITHYRHDKNDPRSIADNIVWLAREDAQGRLWAGTEKGLSRLSADGRGFDNFLGPDLAKEQNHNTIYCMLEHSEAVWFGGPGGLMRFDEDREGVDAYGADGKSGLNSSLVFSLAKGPDNSIWVGTGNAGVNLFEPNKGIATKSYRKSDGLGDEIIYCLLPDRNGARLWVGTHAGLASLDWGGDGRIRMYDESDGLLSATICGIQQDAQGRLWVSTKRGLATLVPGENRFKVYLNADGLQNDEFNENASFHGADGRLYFGGIRGINAFMPEAIKSDPRAPNVKIVDFLVYNEPMALKSTDPASPLTAPVMNLKALALPYHFKMISLEFVALHMSQPKQNKYAFRLDGHDTDWIYTSADRRLATYTSLAPGNYTFRLKGANRDLRWSKEVKLELEVAPPIWRTWWAQLIYALVFIAVLTWYIRLIRGKLEKERLIAEHIRIAAEKDQAIAEQERKTAQRLREIDRLKDEFLANTSHELRTPLNGIIGLAETLLDRSLGELPDSARTNLELIVSSGKRLSTLVNDILDFSQLKNGSLPLNRKPVDAHSLAQVVISLLRPLALRKNLNLENRIPLDLPLVDADENRLQQIFHNLLNNGLKFTHAGQVRLEASHEDGFINFTVVDTGVGIPRGKLSRIFESFEQVDGSAERIFSGSGLGLAITQRLVTLHGGEISIKSKLNEGTWVSFKLAVATGSEAKALEQRRQETQVYGGASARLATRIGKAAPATTNVVNNEGTHVLVVDDEPINRRILVSLLMAESFRVTEACDGPTALGLLEMHADIDLVLLDIMMPRMSGYEVCRRIREKHSVHELPVIILTAKNQQEDLVCGFESGANDYLVKPVAKTELMSRVRTHLSLLNTNRNLEDQVHERTRELQEKNEEILRTQQQLVVQEKMVSLGILTAGISHEINNPTSFVYAGVQNLEADLRQFSQFLTSIAEEEDSEILLELKRRIKALEKHVGIIFEGAGRIRGIVRDLHTFSRSDEAVTKEVELGETIRSTVNLVSAQYHGQVNFVFDMGEDVHLYCRPAELNQVFMNLVVNGCQSIERRLANCEDDLMGTMTIALRRVDDAVEISFEDDGEGIPEALQKRIFEPFFTTKEVGEGTGLGLSISYGIITEHGGALRVTSKPGEGSRFCLSLPLCGIAGELGIRGLQGQQEEGEV